jgi:hypothetical protein
MIMFRLTSAGVDGKRIYIGYETGTNIFRIFDDLYSHPIISYIDGGGAVGFFNDNPQYPVDINGNTRIVGNLDASSYSADGYPGVSGTIYPVFSSVTVTNGLITSIY